MRTLIWWIQLLALGMASSITLAPHHQSSIIEVALRFGRPEPIANQLALLLMPKRDLLRNITDLLYQLRLDHISADMDHEAFVDEYDVAISAINNTINDSRSALSDKKQSVRDFDDEIQAIRDDINDLESESEQCLSESRLFVSMANDIVAERAEQQKQHDAMVQQYYNALATLDQMTETLTIDETIAEIRKLGIDDDAVADCTETVREANSTDSLRLVWQRIAQRLDLVTATHAGAETRYNTTITEYRSVIGEYRAEYDACKADLEQLESDKQRLMDQRDRIQADIDSIQDSIEKAQATMRSLFRSLVKEQLDYDVRAKLTSAELEDLDAAAILINDNMAGEPWPGLCHIGEPGCRRCLYDDNCLEDGQICSEDGLCMEETIDV